MLKARVLTALVLLGAFLGAVFLLPAAGWLLFVAFVCAAGAWEWGGLARIAGGPRVAFALVLGLATLGLGWLADLSADTMSAHAMLLLCYAVSGVFWLLLAPAWLAKGWQVRSVAPMLLVGTVVLLPSALALAHLRQFGPLLLLFAMSLVWIADIAAYFTGRAFGRRKLAPSISPGKTWEGAAGAVGGVMLFGLAVLTFGGWQAEGVQFLFAAPALLVVTVLSIAGDLFESMIKRQAGVKDSGNLLPGHGGVLDRIDSLTSTLPLVALLLMLWAR
ncbi:MAG: phosphatidate cytidylyltransferase [Rhodocyclaceae bacterium]